MSDAAETGQDQGGQAGQVAAGAAATAGAANQGGSDGLPAWKLGLEEELRNDPLLAEFTGEEDVPKIIKGYVHAQKLVGRKGVIMPGKDAKPEEWDKFYADLGRPKEAGEYAIGKPPDWPEGVPYMEEVEQAFRKAAFTAGLTAKQVADIFQWYTGFSLDQHHDYAQQAEELQKQGEKELRKVWGPEFEQNFKAAGGVLVKYGGEALAARHDLHNDPALLAFLFKVSQALGEDTLVQGGPGVATTIDEQITEVEAKMKEMVAKGQAGEGNQDYQALKKRRDRLYAQRHPGTVK